MVIILLIWISIIFIGMKKNEDNSTALTLQNTAALRGIAALEIMLGHIGIATESMILFPNRKAGILFVGIFFALSGYGLMYSTIKKENYLQTFLKRRLPKILVPAYLVFLIGLVIKSVMYGDAGNIVNAVNPKCFFQQTNWYVWELLGMYIVFYICGRIDKSIVKSQYIVWGGAIVFICAAFVLEMDNPWYGSTLCFGLGVFYYTKEEAFKRFFMKRVLLKILVISVLLAFFCVLFFVQKGIVGNLIARNCASVLFVILVLVCLQKYRVGNAVSFWCGKYAYEIFLFHPLFISILREGIQNDILYTVTVIGATLFASFAYRSCADFVKELFKNRIFRGRGSWEE